MRTFLVGLIVVSISSSLMAGPTQHEHTTVGASEFAIPASLKAEHDELHTALASVIRLGGKTGTAAEAVERALAPHFAKEEEYALPPLALLQPLAAGRLTPEMHAMVKVSARLKAQMPRMLEEHQAIVKTLDALAEAARAEGHQDALHFTAKLKLHAQIEEEVLYPAAILVGEYLALRKH
jgi:hypothetical protein